MLMMSSGLIYFIISTGTLISGLILFLSSAHGFFCGLCRTASIIKPFMCLSSFNLSTSSILLDPWYFEIPIAFKPTYPNMDLDLNSFSFSNLFVSTHWNLQALNHIFGEHLNMSALNHSIIDTQGSNHWVWHPNSKGN